MLEIQLEEDERAALAWVEGVVVVEVVVLVMVVASPVEEKAVGVAKYHQTVLRKLSELTENTEKKWKTQKLENKKKRFIS